MTTTGGRRAHITHTRDILKHPTQVIRKTVPRGPTGHLIHIATLPSLGVIADLPNTETNTERQQK